jgi:hypothetical protein
MSLCSSILSGYCSRFAAYLGLKGKISATLLEERPQLLWRKMGTEMLFLHFVAFWHNKRQAEMDQDQFKYQVGS